MAPFLIKATHKKVYVINESFLDPTWKALKELSGKQKVFLKVGYFL